ncbi:MAG: hypothetical protein ACRD88_09500, partial [Terriglobia bacterium]
MLFLGRNTREFCEFCPRGSVQIPEPRRKQGRRSVPSSAPPRGVEESLRQIPSVEEILNWPSLREVTERTSRKFLTERVRETVAALRQEIRDGQRSTAAGEMSSAVLERRVRE